MNESNDQHDTLEHLNDRLFDLVESYSARIANGEKISVDGFAAQHPELAKELKKYLPAVAVLAEFNNSETEVPRGIDETGKLATDRILGDFRIGEEIGRGGMGVVYESEQISIGRKVALKILPFAAVLDDKQITRFKNEARAAGSLDHPNIVPVHAVGEERGVYYYAMALIDGQSMSEVIAEMRTSLRSPATKSNSDNPVSFTSGRDDNGRSATSETKKIVKAELSTQRSTQTADFFRTVAGLGIQAGEALSFAHENGVLHRDIKPANLLLDTKGKLWVTDFGLARLESDSGMTMTGDVLGTLRYMSPEHALGKRVALDYRTDIYSLGITLFELIALQPPFSAVDRQELLKQIASEEATALRKLNTTTPTELETIIHKAINKDPDERYLSAQEMADDLRRYLEDKPILAKRPSVAKRINKWSLRHRAILVTATAATILCLVLASAFLWNERNQTELARIESEDNVRLGLEVLDNLYLYTLGDRLERGQDVSTKERQWLSEGLTFYERFVERAENRSESQVLMARAVRQVGRIYERLGDYEKEKIASSQAQALYERLAKQFPNEPIYEFYLAMVRANSATSHARRGENARALELGHGAIETLHQLRDVNPGDPKYAMALAGVHNQFGKALEHVLGPAQVERHYQAALTLFEELDRNFPNVELPGEFQYTCPGDGRAHSQLYLAGVQKDEDAKTALLQSAMEHLVQAVTRAPRSVWHRRQLAEVCLKVGYETDDETKLRRAADIFRDLQKEFPRVPVYRYWLARSLSSLGSNLDRNGKPADSERSHRGAVVLMTELLDEFPDDLDYHSLLASALHNLSALPDHIVDLNEERRLLEKAIEHEQKAVDSNPQNREYRDFLAQHLGSVAELLVQLNETQLSMRANRDMISHLRVLADNDPERFVRRLLQARTNIGLQLAEAGQLAESEQNLREAIAGWRAVIDGVDPQADDMSWLGAALNRLATILIVRDELRSAKVLLEKAIQHQQMAISLNNHSEQYRRFIIQHYYNLSKIHTKFGDDQQAWSTLAQILDVHSNASTISETPIRNAVILMLATSPEHRDIERALMALKQSMDKGIKTPEVWETIGMVNEKAAMENETSEKHRVAAHAYRRAAQLYVELSVFAKASDALAVSARIMKNLTRAFPLNQEFRDELKLINDETGLLQFRQSPTSRIWLEQYQKTDFPTGSWGGYCVSLDGETLVTGAPFDDEVANAAGAVYVLVRDANRTAAESADDTWSVHAKLTASDAQVGDLFGGGVALQGNLLLVGARMDDDNGRNSGSVYVFENINDQWIQTGKIKPSDGTADDWFGQTLAVSGDVLVATSWNDDNDAGVDAGAAYVFRLTNGAWVEEAKLIGSTVTDYDRFGIRADLQQNEIVVSTYRRNDIRRTGSAYVFVFDHRTNSWVETAELSGSDSECLDAFGREVDIQDDLLTITAIWGHDKTGSAYVFGRDDRETPNDPTDDQWIELQKLTAVDGQIGDQFGRGLAIDTSGTIAITAWGGNSSRSVAHSGSFYLYSRYDNGSPDDVLDDIWIDTAKVGTGIPYMETGSQPIAFQGKTIVIGGSINGGGVHVFANDSKPNEFTPDVLDIRLPKKDTSNTQKD